MKASRRVRARSAKPSRLHNTAQSWHLARWYNTIKPRCAQHCTISAPRWHKLGTSLTQSWHLVGTVLNQPCAQHCTILNLVGNLEQFVYIACCVQLQAGRHFPDIEQGTKIDLQNSKQVLVGVTSANEGAGVVRSGKETVKILRLLPKCQQCLFE